MSGSIGTEWHVLPREIGPDRVDRLLVAEERQRNCVECAPALEVALVQRAGEILLQQLARDRRAVGREERLGIKLRQYGE